MRLILSILLSMSVVFANAQSLVKAEKDEFTGAIIKATSWEVLAGKWSKAYYVRSRRVDDSYFLELSIMLAAPSAYLITEDNPLMLKMSNDSIVKLYPAKQSTPCYGCGSIDGLVGSKSYGSKISYVIPGNVLNTLKTLNVAKLRIYTTDSYFEDDINPKKGVRIAKGIMLISN